MFDNTGSNGGRRLHISKCLCTEYESRKFYKNVNKEMEKVRKGYVIMADFNMVLDKVKDKSVCKKMS